MSNNKMSTVCPEKIFLCDQVIELSSLLDAAIIGDLFYWLAKGEKPWRKAEDYAEMFNVDAKTILRHFDRLTDELKYLSRRRTRLNNGKYGAYRFSDNQTKSSKALLSIYKGILQNSDIANDFGEFNQEEPEYKEVPSIQLLHIGSIAELKCYKSSYLLGRLCWAEIARGQEELFFASKSHFTNWTGLQRKTAIRVLDKLKGKGLIDYVCSDNSFIVRTNSCSLHNFFTSYMDEKQEVRKEKIVTLAA
ncbi:MAG: hypothetical protein VYD79_12880 [Pseudomonadota bacterium]|nr:hypothetical protein [Pseudomonadota bacterium]